MNKYYKPKPEELVDGLKLEMYFEDTWHKFVFSLADNGNIQMEDLRVKYLDSDDFNVLGYTCKKTFLGTQTQIIDIIEHKLKEDEEITEEIDIFDEEVLTILKKGHPVGEFLPYAPNASVLYNVKYEGKTHVVRNLLELRKILK